MQTNYPLKELRNLYTELVKAKAEIEHYRNYKYDYDIPGWVDDYLMDSLTHLGEAVYYIRPVTEGPFEKEV